MRGIAEPWEFSARRGDNGDDVVLRLERQRVDFVEERITYGHLAGTIGHRPVPGEEVAEFEMLRTQAERLWEQLGRALGKVLP